MFFNKLFQKRASSALTVDLAYEKIVAQARHRIFYLAGGIDDTVDGRFDMIVLHVYLLINRMNSDNEAASAEFSQAVFDALFEDMDRSLREMGVGDLSVGKKIKKMAQVFYGRVKAYDEALKQHSEQPDALGETIRRNLFAERAENGEAKKMAGYMRACVDHLEQLETAQILSGNVSFSDPQGQF